MRTADITHKEIRTPPPSLSTHFLRDARRTLLPNTRTQQATNQVPGPDGAGWKHMASIPETDGARTMGPSGAYSVVAYGVVSVVYWWSSSRHSALAQGWVLVAMVTMVTMVTVVTNLTMLTMLNHSY